MSTTTSVVTGPSTGNKPTGFVNRAYALPELDPDRACSGSSSSSGASRRSGCSSTRSATRDGQRNDRLVEGPARRTHPRQLRPDLRRSQPRLGRSLLNSFGDRPPGDDHPDRDRRVRRLRVRVDRLQGPQAAVHRHRRAARHPAAGRPDPAAPAVRQRRQLHVAVPRQDDHADPRLRPRRHDHGGVADPHRLRHAVRDLPAAQLHQFAARRTCSRRRASTERTTSRSSGASCSRCRCRCSPRSPSSSSSGRGTTTCRQHDDRRERQPAARRRSSSPTSPATSAGTSTSCRPAAFVQAFIPLVVFFSLQRYFVRGILAGSVKG